MSCFLVLLAACCAVVAPALGKTFVFSNVYGDTVCIGILGNAGKSTPNGGGFALGAGEQLQISTEDDWAGRFWARTGCSFDGNSGGCETGDCGGVLQCNGAGGAPPASLAEFFLGSQDYYDVSLVDGFNVGLQVSPLSGRKWNSYDCGTAGCLGDLNANCPDELRQINSAGQTVGCKSACVAFNTDQYCCRGSYGTPDTCNPSTWDVNYAAYFKDSCPNAYSYAFDDPSSTFTCSASGYIITVS